MVLIRTNEELNQEEKAVIDQNMAAEAAASPTPLNPTLISTLRNRWEISVRSKRSSGVETRFFKNLDLMNKVYDNERKAAIKEIGGSDIFIGIVESKIRHAKAWIRDALFQPGKRPYGVKPTPVQEVPEVIRAQVVQSFVGKTLQGIQTQAQAMGVQVDMAMAVQRIQEAIPDVQNEIENEVNLIAWEKCYRMDKEIDDKLIDGNWYPTLNAIVPDIVTFGTGVMLGPFDRNKKVLSATQDGVGVETRMIKEFERANPLNVYPQPDSSGPDDGWVFIKLQYRKLDLQELIGVEGFAEEEIRAVLKEATGGQLREWTMLEVDKATREKKDTESVYNTDVIDCLLYMGPLSGQNLKDAGINVPDDSLDMDFISTVWFIGNHYIKAIVNEDPLGRLPISIAHFEENVDGWWGKGLPELIEAEQVAVNACARAVLNNVGMGSGPQVEINVERLKGGDRGDTRLIPWKRWLTTNKGMQTGNAITFWQPNMHAQELLNVMNSFKDGADERSSIPSYAHGDTSVGGAGNTASGLSMLISQAARGIRGIIKSIDDNLITRTVTFIYERIALDPKYKNKVGDVKLVATGSQSLIEKEQRAVRMLEFLNATNNPADLQIMGAEGRGYLLSEVARTYEIDPERTLTRLTAMKGQELGQPPEVPKSGTEIPNRGTPPVATRNLDQAGNEPQGGAAQLIAGRGGPPENPE